RKELLRDGDHGEAGPRSERPEGDAARRRGLDDPDLSYHRQTQDRRPAGNRRPPYRHLGTPRQPLADRPRARECAVTRKLKFRVCSFWFVVWHAEPQTTNHKPQTTNHMIVMKFGGTSVQDAAAIDQVAQIVKGRLERRPVVVVSAMARV